MYKIQINYIYQIAYEIYSPYIYSGEYRIFYFKNMFLWDKKLG